MSESLDKILDIATDKTSIEKAADILQGELVNSDGSALVPATANTTLVPVAAPQDAVRLEDDFEFARKKIRDVISKGHEAIDTAIMLANSSDSPRAFEVVGKMLESLVKANETLITLHKTRQETVTMPGPSSPLLPSGETGSPINIDKAVVFTGRASDLLREIRKIAASTSENPDAPES